jgi:hypothetical protein
MEREFKRESSSFSTSIRK